MVRRSLLGGRKTGLDAEATPGGPELLNATFKVEPRKALFRGSVRQQQLYLDDDQVLN